VSLGNLGSVQFENIGIEFPKLVERAVSNKTLFKMGEDFRLKWNDHHSVFFSSAEQLCHGDHLTDVTLSCGTKEFSAHKLVLSICSNYFNQLFAPRPEGRSRRPADSAAIVYLKDVDSKHMELLLNYMYRGEINVEEKELMGLLATAKGLQIKGLTESDTEEDEPETNDSGSRTSTSKRPAVSRPATSQQPSSKKIKEEHIPKHESLIAEVDQSGVDEEDAGTHHDYPNQASNSQFIDIDDPSELIEQSDYSLDGNQSGEGMVYEGDPENSGDSAGQGSGRFQCEVCLKNFKGNFNLKQHSVVHTKENHFVCEICDKGFSQPGSRNRHMKNKHPDHYQLVLEKVYPKFH